MDRRSTIKNLTAEQEEVGRGVGMVEKEDWEDAGSVKTVEEAGRRFTEKLLRHHRQDRPDERADFDGEGIG